ncbi:ATP-binding protein [Paracoccus shandongensis]|uniref:ATP-binding protein n=1 Tax=Paracoccus shandongensis TaxID=2816048 RepID=UPI001A8E8AA6|nr:ATP-binding protein [Paracoccus shandongensis]
MDSRDFPVKGRLDAVDAAMASVCAFVGDALPAEDLIRLEIALTEALTNIVLHGGLPPGAGIGVSVRKDAPGITVEIRDPGRPVPVALFRAARDPAAIDPLEESGRGIPLIVALSDTLDYDSRDGVNRLVLRFAGQGS